VLPYKKKVINSSRDMEIKIAIGKFLACDMRSLHTIECNGFINMINVLELEFIIPERKTFRNTIIPGIYENLKKSLIFSLISQENLVITFDG